MNKVYLYDGKYSSLIVLIIELLKNRIIPLNIKAENNYEINLLDETVYLKIDQKNMMYFNKLSKNIIRDIYYVFLSDQKNKELLIYEFLKNAFKYREKVFEYRNIEAVNEVIKVAKYVGSEAHKYKGFLRFKHVQNKFYYAEIEPNNNIISILAYHFKTRLSTEPWIIHDLKRQIYAFYDMKKVFYLTEEIDLNLGVDEEEIYMNDLWKTFFNKIAIKERKNLKCQMNFMPKRYWNHMLEMEDKI